MITVMCNMANAQNQFPDEHVIQKWEYVTWYFWGGKCELRKIKNAEVVEKCNTNYIKVLDCNENEDDCFILGYYRIQGDSVLVRTNHKYYNGALDTVVCSEPEGLMYDFSTTPYDTLICQINSTWPPTFTKFWEIDKQFIEYEGIERQTTDLRYIPHPNAPYFLYRMNWIDGIGSNVHPFYSFTCIGDHCELEQQLTRVIRNDQLIYQDTTLNFFFPCTGWISSTNNVDLKQPLLLLPNPADNFLTIRSNSNNSSVKLSIYDMQGKEISSLDHYVFGEPFNIEYLREGIYIIQVFDGNQIQNLKLIKK